MASKTVPGTSAVPGDNPSSDEKSRSQSSTIHEGGWAPAGQRDYYARATQQACSVVLQRMRLDTKLISNKLASPMTAIPPAVSAMAILFKIADQKEALGLEVGEREISDGDEIVATLPSVLLRHVPFHQ